GREDPALPVAPVLLAERTGDRVGHAGHVRVRLRILGFGRAGDELTQRRRPHPVDLVVREQHELAAPERRGRTTAEEDEAGDGPASLPPRRPARRVADRPRCTPPAGQCTDLAVSSSAIARLSPAPPAGRLERKSLSERCRRRGGGLSPNSSRICFSSASRCSRMAVRLAFVRRLIIASSPWTY